MRSVWIDGERNEVEARVVGAGQHQLHRLAERLGGERGGHRVVAVEPAPEAAAERIGAHDDALLRQAKRLREHGQDQALPLIAGVDLEAAVLLEGKRVHRFELGMQHAGRGVGPLERGRGRAKGGHRCQGRPPPARRLRGAAICFAP